MTSTESEPLTAVKTSPSPLSDVITLMIVDDHPVVREGLAAIFKSQKDIKIVAEAGDGDEACKLYDEHIIAEALGGKRPLLKIEWVPLKFWPAPVH